ncbi:CADD family putative folate metabolism protein [Alloacidobacterium sp.]|uniref:CADD family putative folate metabolism protein n=1 Tax=Alloacidobacterium sp. TaxID=2951999 RepID=UPI002D715BA6|nr:CADD family putative folate metabolism protein [Alloacidobacterium sp.]HYK35192.1 CADD family putative folate metabolism protein [Alloacidobacterium sp.]
MENIASQFFVQAEERIERYNLLKHPFYTAWTAGELIPEDLREYAAEYWHHVSAFPAYLSALHSRLQDGATRRMIAANLADEEGVGSPDGRAHSDLWMDFAKGMGASESEVKNRALQPEMQQMIASFERIATEGSPTAALAAFYAYESRVPAIAREKAAGLKEHYSADSATIRYFALHQTADIHHAAVWRALIADELPKTPEAVKEGLDAAEQAAAALWSALDGVERGRQMRKNLATACA